MRSERLFLAVTDEHRHRKTSKIDLVDFSGLKTGDFLFTFHKPSTAFDPIFWKGTILTRGMGALYNKIKRTATRKCELAITTVASR